jgi:hypothetical protein
MKSPPKQKPPMDGDEKMLRIVHEKGAKLNAPIHNLDKMKTLNSLSDTR